jgi:dephospho-CoA kinase
MGDTTYTFGIAGLPGAGKSVAAEYLADAILDGEATATEMSDFVRTKFEASQGVASLSANSKTSRKFEAEHDDEVTDNELGAWAAEQKAEYGQGYFARQLAETWQDPDRPHTVVSGLRSPEEATALRDAFGETSTVILSIWTLPGLRFKRKYGADPRVDHPDWDTFIERRDRELYEWNCLDYFTGNVADFIVPNNDGVGQFVAKLQDIYAQVEGADNRAIDLEPDRVELTEFLL